MLNAARGSCVAAQSHRFTTVGSRPPARRCVVLMSRDRMKEYFLVAVRNGTFTIFVGSGRVGWLFSLKSCTKSYRTTQ